MNTGNFEKQRWDDFLGTILKGQSMTDFGNLKKAKDPTGGLGEFSEALKKIRERRERGGEVPIYVIALLGGKNFGKTCFLTATNEHPKIIGYDFRLKMTSPEEEFYRYKYNNDGLLMLPDSTSAAETRDVSFRWVCGPNGQTVCDVYVFDYTGQSYEDKGNKNVKEMLEISDGLVVFIDPLYVFLSDEDVKSDFSGMSRLQDVLDEHIQSIIEQKALVSNRKTKMPIALAVGKLDSELIREKTNCELPKYEKRRYRSSWKTEDNPFGYLYKALESLEFSGEKNTLGDTLKKRDIAQEGFKKITKKKIDLTAAIFPYFCFGENYMRLNRNKWPDGPKSFMAAHSLLDKGTLIPEDPNPNNRSKQRPKPFNVVAPFAWILKELEENRGDAHKIYQWLIEGRNISFNEAVKPFEFASINDRGKLDYC